MRKPTNTLYRMFDATGRLLYVGITLDVGQRFTDHKREKSWWADIEVIRLQQYGSRKELEEAERVAIATENPAHNMKPGRPVWVPTTDEQRQAIEVAQQAAAHVQELRQAMWDEVQSALDIGVPAAFMAETVGRGRATLYRHATPPGSNSQAIETDEERGELTP